MTEDRVPLRPARLATCCHYLHDNEAGNNMDCTNESVKINKGSNAFERGEIAAVGTFAEAFCYTPSSTAISSSVFQLSPPPLLLAGQGAVDFIVLNDRSLRFRSPDSLHHTIYVTKTNAPKLPQVLDAQDASIWLASPPSLAMKSSLEQRLLSGNPSSFRQPFRMKEVRKDDRRTTFVTMSG